MREKNKDIIVKIMIVVVVDVVDKFIYLLLSLIY